jgi:hypothetical protein
LSRASRAAHVLDELRVGQDLVEQAVHQGFRLGRRTVQRRGVAAAHAFEQAAQGARVGQLESAAAPGGRGLGRGHRAKGQRLHALAFQAAADLGVFALEQAGQLGPGQAQQQHAGLGRHTQAACGLAQRPGEDLRAQGIGLAADLALPAHGRHEGLHLAQFPLGLLVDLGHHARDLDVLLGLAFVDQGQFVQAQRQRLARWGRGRPLVEGFAHPPRDEVLQRLHPAGLLLLQRLHQRKELLAVVGERVRGVGIAQLGQGAVDDLAGQQRHAVDDGIEMRGGSGSAHGRGRRTMRNVGPDPCPAQPG